MSSIVEISGIEIQICRRRTTGRFLRALCLDISLQIVQSLLVIRIHSNLQTTTTGILRDPTVTSSLHL